MITVEGLTKKYGAFTAVDDISFQCRPGEVTGFLGPNGAGKTTTLRILSGLTPPTAGTAMIDGVKYHDVPNPGTQIGILLDASAQHGGRTAREILTISALTMGLPRTRVDAMLELVGLTHDEAKRRVKNYSLGMRQRLGLANALLGDPKILVLDEPANGLDPAGIHWMRGLLRQYADRGGTVLLSSHLLHEIEVIADDLVVIGNGRIVASGPKEELLSGQGAFVRAGDLKALENALGAAGIGYRRSGEGLAAEADPEEVGKAALSGGVALSELRGGEGAGLEQMFLDLTASTQRDETGAF